MTSKTRLVPRNTANFQQHQMTGFERYKQPVFRQVFVCYQHLQRLNVREFGRMQHRLPAKVSMSQLMHFVCSKPEP
jgi:hypothetical protein